MERRRSSSERDPGTPRPPETTVGELVFQTYKVVHGKRGKQMALSVMVS